VSEDDDYGFVTRASSQKIEPVLSAVRDIIRNLRKEKKEPVTFLA